MPMPEAESASIWRMICSILVSFGPVPLLRSYCARMNEADELAEILSGMGSTAEAVALTLSAAGIKGVRNTVRFLNPVVRYCQAKLRLDDYALDLLQGDILRMVLPNERTVEAQLPPPVHAFLAAFHGGSFPTLELSMS